MHGRRHHIFWLARADVVGVTKFTVWYSMSIKKVSHNYVYVIIGVKNWINIVNPGATRGPGGGQAGFCMGEPHIKSHPSGGSRITLARIDLYGSTSSELGGWGGLLWLSWQTISGGPQSLGFPYEMGFETCSAPGSANNSRVGKFCKAPNFFDKKWD